MFYHSSKHQKKAKNVLTSACLRQISRFLRWALEKWSHAFCLEAAWNTDTICSTVVGMQGRTRNHPETEREKERERAGGKEQRSEKVESTMDVKNYVSIRDVPYSTADNDQKSMTVVDLFDLIHLCTNIMHRWTLDEALEVQQNFKVESLGYKNLLI